MTIKKTYRTKSNVRLNIRVKPVPENDKPFYGSYSVMTNEVIPEKNKLTHKNFVGDGDVYDSEQEAIDKILEESIKLLPDELQEKWIDIEEWSEEEA